MSYILGIDPGKHGAISLLQNGSLGSIWSLEGVGPVDLPILFNEFKKVEIDGVFIEDVHASPQMGVVSAFSFGKGFGALLAICYAYYMNRVRLVRPSTWQAALGCLAGGDKATLFEYAKKQFPTGKFKRDHADALLISLYGFKYLKYN